MNQGTTREGAHVTAFGTYRFYPGTAPSCMVVAKNVTVPP